MIVPMSMKRPSVTHPWRRLVATDVKLRDARAIAKRRYRARHYQDDIEWERLRHRTADRIKQHIPVDQPVMRPWDWIKRRVKRKIDKTE